MWELTGRLGYKPDDKNPDNWLKTQFPARYIYEKILPEAVEAHSPGTEYRRGCPYGNPDRPDGWDLTVGDVHQWNVWHGTQEPYQNFDKLAGRFVSEFGMEASPDIKTIESFLPSDGTEHHAFSATVEFHNKADCAERRIAAYLAENMRFEHKPFEAYIYSTQLMQAEALSNAYRTWRRNWKGPGRELTSGALVWQINDCWPVTSWAIVDYYLRPKVAYFTIKRELAPIVLGSKRIEVKIPNDPYTGAHVEISHRIEVWSSSFLLEEQGSYKLVAKSFDVTSGKMLESSTLKKDFSLLPNRTTELVDADASLPGWNGKRDGNLEVVVALYLLDADGRHVARTISWPEPLKYVKVSKNPGLGLLSWRGKVKIRADVPVKGLVLTSDEGEWDDQGVDLVPGEIVEVSVKGLGKGGVGARCYGGGEKGMDVRCVEAENWEV